MEWYDSKSLKKKRKKGEVDARKIKEYLEKKIRFGVILLFFSNENVMDVTFWRQLQMVKHWFNWNEIECE